MLCMLAFTDLCELTIAHINLLKPDLSLRFGAMVQHVQKEKKRSFLHIQYPKQKSLPCFCVNIFSF